MLRKRKKGTIVQSALQGSAKWPVKRTSPLTPIQKHQREKGKAVLKSALRKRESVMYAVQKRGARRKLSVRLKKEESLFSGFLVS